MGTRGLLGFIIAAQRRATFIYADAYPEGLGLTIANFILSLDPKEYAIMTERLRNITWVDYDEVPSAEMVERYSKAFSPPQTDCWGTLLVDPNYGGQLPAIKSGLLEHLLEQTMQNVFWEWSYFIDFENQMMEVWKIDGGLWTEVTFEELIAEGAEAIMAAFKIDYDSV